jgi:hypothetical protein
VWTAQPDPANDCRRGDTAGGCRTCHPWKRTAPFATSIGLAERKTGAIFGIEFRRGPGRSSPATSDRAGGTEFMLPHMGEPMIGREDLQAEARRQGRDID